MHYLLNIFIYFTNTSVGSVSSSNANLQEGTARSVKRSDPNKFFAVFKCFKGQLKDNKTDKNKHVPSLHDLHNNVYVMRNSH